MIGAFFAGFGVGCVVGALAVAVVIFWFIDEIGHGR